MGSDIIIWPTLLSIHRSWEIPWTVNILGVHEFKDRIVYRTHLVGCHTVLPTSSLTLFHTSDLESLTEKSICELLNSTELTSPSGHFWRNLGSVSIEISAHERTNKDTTILTVYLGTDVIILVVRILTILLVNFRLIEGECNYGIKRQVRSTTKNCICSSILVGLTNCLALTLTREHRTNEFSFVWHKWKIKNIRDIVPYHGWFNN